MTKGRKFPRYKVIETVIYRYSNKEFRRDFRINKDTFNKIKERLTPILQYEDRESGKPGLSVEKQILVFLWYISNQDVIREIGRLFGISTSTAHTCIRRVASALCEIRNSVIKWPDLEEQNTISTEVENRYHIPNVIGFIDGTHIRLTAKPSDDYINRKGYASLNVQLLVDNKLRVLDCYAGWPGAAHDARVYRNSPVFHGLRQGRLPLGENNFMIGNFKNDADYCNLILSNVSQIWFF